MHLVGCSYIVVYDMMMITAVSTQTQTLLPTLHIVNSISQLYMPCKQIF
jgi:hypothetical protein